MDNPREQGRCICGAMEQAPLLVVEIFNNGKTNNGACLIATGTKTTIWNTPSKTMGDAFKHIAISRNGKISQKDYLNNDSWQRFDILSW
jgi:hypothetical protein